jgi:hypothetical protein
MYADGVYDDWESKLPANPRAFTTSLALSIAFLATRATLLSILFSWVILQQLGPRRICDLLFLCANAAVTVCSIGISCGMMAGDEDSSVHVTNTVYAAAVIQFMFSEVVTSLYAMSSDSVKFDKESERMLSKYATAAGALLLMFAIIIQCLSAPLPCHSTLFRATTIINIIMSCICLLSGAIVFFITGLVQPEPKRVPLNLAIERQMYESVESKSRQFKVFITGSQFELCACVRLMEISRMRERGAGAELIGDVRAMNVSKCKS